MNTPDWGVGAALNYTGTAQNTLGEFNYDYLVGTTWVDRRITEKLSAHLQGDYAYGWVDGDSWVSEVAATPALDYDLGAEQLHAPVRPLLLEQLLLHPPTSRRDPFDPERVPAGCNVQTQAAQPRRPRRAGRARAGRPADGDQHAAHRRAALYTRYHAQGSEYSFRGVGGWLHQRDAAAVAAHAAAARRASPTAAT